MKPSTLRDDTELHRLDALCRSAHELARERLIDDPDILRSSRPTRLAVYRSLRKLKTSEAALRDDFVERALTSGMGEATAYASAVASLELAPMVSELLQRAFHDVMAAYSAGREFSARREFESGSHCGAAALAASTVTSIEGLPAIGTLFDWHTPEHDPIRLKLCWRSSTTGWHVFVNAAGVKTLELPLRRVLACLDSRTLVAVPR